MSRVGSGGPAAVLHIPHASWDVPEEVRPTFALSDAELGLELLRMTDSFTDRLFDLDPAVATAVVYPVSRLVVDPERFLDDAVEPMAARGMGVLYTHTSQRTPMRRMPVADERETLLARWYHPHHARLTEAVDAVLRDRGACLVVDCHSFPSKPHPCDLDQAPDRPDICLGTDAYHTPASLTDDARRAFEQAGFDVAIDRPFAGALVPARHFRSDRRVSALMVEVNRALYMDEDSGRPRDDFEELRGRLRAILLDVIGAATRG